MQIVVSDRDSLAAVRREVDAELDAVEAAASRFRSDSEINVLARSAGQPTEISDVLADLLDAALTSARLTDGDVDPTVGAALIELGYDSEYARRSEVTQFAHWTTIPATWYMVTLHGRVATVPAGVVLDLGATAKAVAADRCAARARLATAGGVLVNLGGDIATAGPAPEGGWQVLVQDDDGDPASSIGLPTGAALATSSTVRRQWRRGGLPVHHILNPRTGLPADPVWRTVTVAARTCFAANTVSTAAVIRGRRAPKWIESLGMTARLVDRDMTECFVGGWPTGARAVTR
ncbi:MULTISPECIES: FAD:protein FMN transferase [unclassified Mycolicibacterium]|uniref:FAD:protein FMN transferase n=1 Tax=unclassified Mycolicibacterium TaxID=2636767 RepID=UPI002ED7C60A